MINRKSRAYQKAEQELYYTMTDSKADWFSARLIRLIMKADSKNKQKLESIYPEFVDVVMRYKTENGYWQKVKEKYEPKERPCGFN